MRILSSGRGFRAFPYRLENYARDNSIPRNERAVEQGGSRKFPFNCTTNLRPNIDVLPCASATRAESRGRCQTWMVQQMFEEVPRVPLEIHSSKKDRSHLIGCEQSEN